MTPSRLYSLKNGRGFEACTHRGEELPFTGEPDFSGCIPSLMRGVVEVFSARPFLLSHYMLLCGLVTTLMPDIPSPLRLH